MLQSKTVTISERKSAFCPFHPNFVASLLSWLPPTNTQVSGNVFAVCVQLLKTQDKYKKRLFHTQPTKLQIRVVTRLQHNSRHYMQLVTKRTVINITSIAPRTLPTSPFHNLISIPVSDVEPVSSGYQKSRGVKLTRSVSNTAPLDKLGGRVREGIFYRFNSLAGPV